MSYVCNSGHISANRFHYSSRRVINLRISFNASYFNTKVTPAYFISP